MNEKKLEIEDLLLKISLSVNHISKLVGCTFGPMGRNIVFRTADGQLEVTRCGKAVVEHMEIADDVKRQPLSMIKELAQAQFRTVGDGITLLIILTDAILSKAIKGVISAGADPYAITSGLEKAILVVDRALALATRKADIINIQKIARTACKDAALGDLVTRLFEDFRVSSIELTAGLNTNDEAGTRDAIVLPYLDMEIAYPESRLLLWEEPILSEKDIKPLLEDAVAKSSSLCIIAPMVSREVKIYIDKVRKDQHVSCLLIDPPTDIPFNPWIRDLALLTGGKVLSTVGGFTLSDITVFALVRIYNLKSLNGLCTIGFDRSKGALPTDERIKALQIRSEMAEDESRRTILEKRIKLLRAKIGYINIGAHSRLELDERKRMARRAIRAVESAIETGVVPGGGVALLHCIHSLKQNLGHIPAPESTGVEVMIRAMEAPFRRICLNAGLEPDMLIEKLKEDPEKGFVLPEFKIVNIDDMEAFDSVITLKQSLVNSVKLTKALIETAHLVIR